MLVAEGYSFCIVFMNVWILYRIHHRRRVDERAMRCEANQIHLNPKSCKRYKMGSFVQVEGNRTLPKDG